MFTNNSLSKIASDAVARLTELKDSLRGWIVLCSVHEPPKNGDEDIAHALAVEGRELVIKSLRLTFELGAAGLRGNKSRFDQLLKRLEELDERERKLAVLCREVMCAKNPSSEKSTTQAIR